MRLEKKRNYRRTIKIDCGVNNDIALQSDVSESDQDELEQDSSVRSKQVRQPPVWLQGYVKF
jgi:hypothetical protein